MSNIFKNIDPPLKFCFSELIKDKCTKYRMLHNNCHFITWIKFELKIWTIFRIIGESQIHFVKEYVPNQLYLKILCTDLHCFVWNAMASWKVLERHSNSISNIAINVKFIQKYGYSINLKKHGRHTQRDTQWKNNYEFESNYVINTYVWFIFFPKVLQYST